MGKYVIDGSTLAAIADAIRAKGGTSAAMIPGEMAALIEAIGAGVGLPSWITEIDFVTATVSSNATSIQFASAMTAKAANFIVWASTFNSPSSGTGVTVIGKLGSYEVMIAGTMADDGGLCSPTASLSGGKMTIYGTGASNYYFSAGSTYRAIMWR